MDSQRSLSYAGFGLLLAGLGLLAVAMARGLVDFGPFAVPHGLLRLAIVALPALGLAFFLQGLAGFYPDSSGAARILRRAGFVLGGVWLFAALAGIAGMLTWMSFAPAGAAREIALAGIPFELPEPARTPVGRIVAGALALLLDLLLLAFLAVFIGSRLESLGKLFRRKPA